MGAGRLETAACSGFEPPDMTIAANGSVTARLSATGIRHGGATRARTGKAIVRATRGESRCPAACTPEFARRRTDNRAVVTDWRRIAPRGSAFAAVAFAAGAAMFAAGAA